MQWKGVGSRQERGRERRRKSEMQSVVGKVCGVDHKLDHWSSIYEDLEAG